MKKHYKIGIIPGDGIGKDVVNAGLTVLETLNTLMSETELEFVRMDAGVAAFDKYADPLPEETLKGISATDACLFGAAGAPHNFKVIRGMRAGFDLFAKVCPVKSFPGANAIHQNADLVIVRENTEGLYRNVGYIDGDYHVNLRVMTTDGMERIIRFGFELAVKEKRNKVTLAHKAPALKYTDAPMKELFYEIAKKYPDIEAADSPVDSCAMHLVMKPESFDVIIAENAFGDILCDVGAGITGGLGMAPSGNIGLSTAIFEPVHGTAPKYAGKNVVNPIATIMSCKMMFDYLGQVGIAQRIERAVSEVLHDGKVTTFDLGGTSSTTEVANEICNKISKSWNEGS